MQTFVQPYVMTEGGPNNASLLYVLYLYNKAFQQSQMGYASALAWVLFVVIAVLSLIVFRTSSRWVHYAGRSRGMPTLPVGRTRAGRIDASGDFTQAEVLGAARQHHGGDRAGFTPEALLATVWRRRGASRAGQPLSAADVLSTSRRPRPLARDRPRRPPGRPGRLIVNRVTHLDQLADKLRKIGYGALSSVAERRGRARIQGLR